jgi:hypothetical protein
MTANAIVVEGPRKHFGKVAALDGVGPGGSRGEVFGLLRLGRRELGHLHGDALADIPFPQRLRDELTATGRATPHHVLPDSAWISFRIESTEDVERAIQLLRLVYARATAARSRNRSSELMT